MLSVSQTKKKTMLPISILETLVGQPDSGIHKIQDEIHVALFPLYLNNVQLGLYSYLNKQINRWHPKLQGILAAYGKLKLRHATGTMNDEESHFHLDVISDFWVFRPVIGGTLKGIVTKKSPSHISCLVHGAFNVPCHRPVDLEQDQTWFGSKIPIGKTVRFTVIKMDLSQKVPFILGDLREERYYDEPDPFGGQISFVKDETDWTPDAPTQNIHELPMSEKQEESDSGIDSNDKNKRKRKRDKALSPAEPASAPKRVKKSKGQEAANISVATTEEPVLSASPVGKQKKKKKDKKRGESVEDEPLESDLMRQREELLQALLPSRVILKNVKQEPVDQDIEEEGDQSAKSKKKKKVKNEVDSAPSFMAVQTSTPNGAGRPEGQNPESRESLIKNMMSKFTNVKKAKKSK